MKKSIYNNIIINENDKYLYYNSASGAIVWIDDYIHKAINNNIAAIKDKNILLELEKNGFIVPNAIDEFGRHMNKSKQFKADMFSDIASFVIAPTMACNLRCVYCFEAGRYCNEIMSKETQDSVYHFITNSILLKNKKRLHISWFGGEPMLAYSVIENLSTRLIAFCFEHNIEYTAAITTNGSLLDKETIIKLYKEYKIQNIQITIDGDRYWYKKLKNGTDKNYDNVLKNIVLIGKSPITLSLRLNVCNENVKAFKSIIDYLISDNEFHAYIYPGKLLKYSKTNDFTEIEDGKFKEFKDFIRKSTKHFPEYKKMYSKKLEPKGAGCGYMVDGRGLIDYKGFIYRCEHQINDARFAIGDVNNGFYYNDIDKMFMEYKLPKKCEICSVLPVCMGGCASDVVIDEKTTNCKSFMEDISHMVKTIAGINNE